MFQSSADGCAGVVHGSAGLSLDLRRRSAAPPGAVVVACRSPISGAGARQPLFGCLRIRQVIRKLQPGLKPSSSAVRPSHPWPPADRDPPARSIRHPHRAGHGTRPDQASPPPARWAGKQHLHDGLRLTRPGGTASAGTPRGVGLPAPAAPVHADQRHFSAVAAAAPDADLAGRHGLIWGKISVKKSCREGRSDPVRSLTSSWFVWAALRLAFFFIR